MRIRYRWSFILILAFITCIPLFAVAITRAQPLVPLDSFYMFESANLVSIAASETKIDSHWSYGLDKLLILPNIPLSQPLLDESYVWTLFAPPLKELQTYNLMGEITPLSNSNIVHVTWLSPLAIPRLADAGIIILPDTNTNRSQLGLLSNTNSCQPLSQTSRQVPLQDVPSFIVDTTLDYVEGYLDPYTAITVTLYSANNAIKGRQTSTALSNGQYRVCFEQVNLISGDRLDIRVAGLTPLHLAVPTVTLEVDSMADQVWGLAPAGMMVSVQVESPEGYSSEQNVVANAFGEYSVSFAGVQDIADGNRIQVSIEGERRDTYRLSSFLPSRITVGSTAQIKTIGSVPARLKVRNVGGDVYQTFEGMTNRIGDVCQPLEDLSPGDLMEFEVEETTTPARLPTINAYPGTTQVTGVGDANANITCSISGSYNGIAVTTSGPSGEFTCDFAGLHTLEQGDLVQITAQQAERSAHVQSYVPVGLNVYAASRQIRIYTRPHASVSLTLRDDTGMPLASFEGVSDMEGVIEHRSEVVLEPGYEIEAVSEGQLATVIVPEVLLDEENNLISGMAEPNAQVSAYINWGGPFTTTTGVDGQFYMNITGTAEIDGGFKQGDSVNLSISDDTNSLISMFGYVPIKLSFGVSYLGYSDVSVYTWPNLSGHWQILDQDGRIRAGQSFTTTPSLPHDQIHPGDLISITIQSNSATLRVPTIKADVLADTVIGLAQPRSEIDLTVDGVWGEQITRTLTADEEGIFTANFTADHDLFPGDAVRLEIHEEDDDYIDITYYVPARISIYQSEQYVSIAVYTAPLTRTQVIIRGSDAQVAVSRTITSSFDGEVYLNVKKDILSEGTLEIQTAAQFISYPFRAISAWIDREQDSLIGTGPINANLQVEMGSDEPIIVRTDDEGWFSLNLAGQEDLHALSYLTVRYVNVDGIEQRTGVSAPSVSVNVTTNIVSISNLPSETTVRLKDEFGFVKETQVTSVDENYYNPSATFVDITPGDTVEVDYPIGIISIPVSDLSGVLDKVTDEVMLSGPPGDMGQLSLYHSGVERIEGHYADSIAAGDDGIIRLAFQGIYNIWNNTSLSFCLEQPTGDTVCTTAWTPGLIVDVTNNTVTGHILSEPDANVVIKRGISTRGSVQVMTDETSAFTIRNFCQAGSPVNISSGDYIVLNGEIARVDILGISTNIDTDSDTLLGMGPSGVLLDIQFYTHKTSPMHIRSGGGGGGQSHPYASLIVGL